MIVLTAVLGCMHRGAAPTVAADAPPPVGSAEVDALTEAEAELAANAAELNALGVRIAWGPRDAEVDPIANAAPPVTAPETPEIEPDEPDTPAPPTNPSKPTIVTPEPKPGPRDDPKSSTPCQRICTLASVACDLSKRICQLAENHQGDARYEDACWNAGRQCEDASDACSDCAAC